MILSFIKVVIGIQSKKLAKQKHFINLSRDKLLLRLFLLKFCKNLSKAIENHVLITK